MLVALGLSMDCAAVSIAGSIAMPGLPKHAMLRAAACFGLFQAGMLVLGWLLGHTVVGAVEDYDHWVAFALLLIVGARMIDESLGAGNPGRERTDVTRGLTLLTLSVATSIDALAVGLGLGFLGSRLAVASSVVGVTAFLVTLAGFLVGRAVGASLGRWAEVVGGMVLIGIGVRIVVTHVWQ